MTFLIGRLTALASGVACASLLYAGPFLGFSTATMNGGNGLRGMNLACQATFGPDSRLCFSQEILESPNLPEQVGYGWAHPIFAPVSGGTNPVADVSGVVSADASTLSCVGWAMENNSWAGLTVHGDTFEFAGHACGEEHHVACCQASRCYVFPVTVTP